MISVNVRSGKKIRRVDAEPAVYVASDIKPRKRRKSLEIQRIRDAIKLILEQDNPATVRSVFYRLVSLGWVEKTEIEYQRTAIRLLLEMRLSGDVPWDWVSDNTRWVRRPTMFSDAADALDHAARAYRRDLWESQDDYVEVWTEKDAMAGVLIEETYSFGVPLMVSRGFASASYLHSCAENIRRIGKPTFIYYFGDHDPSGVRIDPAIERRLRQFAPDADITFVRAAVTREQIEELKLPTRPTKKSNHSRGFKGRSVEVDAIPPATIRQICRDCIERHIDQRALEITRTAEAHEREVMRQFAARFRDGGES